MTTATNPCTCGQRYADPSVACAPECMSNMPVTPRDSADVDFSALAKACASQGPVPECRSAGGIVIAEALKSKDAEIAGLREAVLYAERALEIGTIAARDAVTTKIAVLRAKGLLVPAQRPKSR